MTSATVARGRVTPLLAALTLAGVTILCALGAWQLARKSEKEALIAAISARSQQTPLPFAEIARHRAGTLEFRRVTLSGQFDHEREVLVWTVTRAGAGYSVITPLTTPDGLIVPVIRGFTPDARRDKATRTQGLIAGEVALTGRLRFDERPGLFTPANDPARGAFYVRNLAAMAPILTGLADPAAASARIAPVFVELETPAPPGGLPKPDIETVNLSNNHLGYALTWFGLAATLIGVFLAYARRGRSERDAASDGG